MKKNKGAISVFALLAMMFFMTFITVAYNNVYQKGKSQVEIEGVLVDTYKSEKSAGDIINEKYGGDPSSIILNSKLRGLEQVGSANSSSNKNKYIYSNGKCYKIVNDYEQLEYIEADNEQYIDTGLKFNNKYQIEMKFKFLTFPSIQTWLTGAWQNSYGILIGYYNRKFLLLCRG